MNETDALAVFDALSNATRLKMLRSLIAAGPTGLTAGDVAEAVGASPSRASFHLSTLAKAGVVTSERVARQMIFRADYGRLAGLVDFLVQDCCRNDPNLVACLQGRGCP